MTRRGLIWVLGAIFAGVVSGCAQKSVNDVLADPGRYARHDIAIKGRVMESFSVAGKGFYRVEDPTGRLWVFSSRGVPRKGAKVRVKGKIRDGFDLTSVSGFIDLPAPIQERIESGILMIESSHKASG
jgi:hypothetical protein